MSFFTHPLIAGLDMGSPAWFGAQREMIRRKPAVRRCYELWYALLLADAASVPGEGALLELGSGSSYLKELNPALITSDVVPGPVDMVLDGQRLPFRDASVKALLLTHVFHHIPDVRLFLAEAQRVLLPGGVIAMIDCAHTPLSRAFFTHIHPEPYRPDAEHWDFPPGHSMLDSNQALSWIVFERDQDSFRREFPGLRLEQRDYLPWFSYLLSGGVNLRSLLPAGGARLYEKLDAALRPLDRFGAIHWHIRVRKAAA